MSLEIPVARVFRPLLEPARYKGAYGGRGSGKSHFFAEQAVIRNAARPLRGVCVREVQNTIRDSVRQLLVDKIAAHDLGGLFDITDAEIRGGNGSLIIFRGMQSYNAENIKSLENFDWAWIEEAQTLSARSLGLLRPTIRNEGSELWFSWNPRHSEDPVDAFFRGEKKHPDAISVFANWNDNPWFPEVLLKEKDADYAKDPDVAEHVWGGAYESIAEGAYYARLMLELEKAGRIMPVPYDPSLGVVTAWDLGYGDSTAIWFCQQVAGEVRLIDYYESAGVGLDHYIKTLQQKCYIYRKHYMPHDADQGHLGTGKSLVELARGMGVANIEVVPKLAVDSGIHAVRLLLPTCVFDPKCERGIKALREYRKEYDEELRIWKPKPLHDWASHGADAFRYLAVALRPQAAAPHKPRYRDKPKSTGSWMAA